MKRFSKIALSVASVSAVAMAMAISASAMTASYADGVVTLSDVNSTGTSQTLLVLDTVDLETVAAENIKQIDQKDDGTSFVTVPVGELSNGIYEVRIGGDGTIQKATFEVGSAVVGEEVQMGDVNLDTTVNGSDINPVIQHVVGNATLEGKSFFVADVNSDTTVNGSDINPIIQHIVGNSTLPKANYIAE